MSAVASANLEIDYLRGQLREAKIKLQDVSIAKAVLRKNGYFVENLWCVDDVTQNYDCTEEQAQRVLEISLTNDATMEQIWLAIGDACDYLEIKSNQD